VGGLLGKLALAFTVAYLALPKESVRSSNNYWRSGLQPFVAFPVGLGEESFFRGFLQSRLSETLTPLGGIILSAIALIPATHTL
jgi:CAAX amino terminal protease family.